MRTLIPHCTGRTGYDLLVTPRIFLALSHITYIAPFIVYAATYQSSNQSVIHASIGVSSPKKLTSYLYDKLIKETHPVCLPFVHIS